jgi:glycerol-3-phosphate dehydrogenase
VIGGGIHGLAAAYDAASRGCAPRSEAADFGSAASFNHQKTVHGGRDRCMGRLGYACRSIHERRALPESPSGCSARCRFWLAPIDPSRRLLRPRGVQARRTAGPPSNDGVEPELHLPGRGWYPRRRFGSFPGFARRI